MRCLFYWLGKAWNFVLPTLQQFSGLPFDPASLGIIVCFLLFLSICGIFVTILEELEPTLTGHYFQPGWSLQGSGWFRPFSFLSALLWVNMFLLGFSLAAHTLQPICPLHSCNLLDFHEDFRVLSQPNGFCDNTASDLCPQHLQYNPWITLQQHFTLFLSSLCGVLGWSFNPSNLFVWWSREHETIGISPI